jgi:protein glucosyltransferase
MRKALLFFATVLFLLWLGKAHVEGAFLKRVGYIVHFQKKGGRYYRQFRQKTSSPTPLWMQEQISQDLHGVRISLAALETTYAKAKSHSSRILRYRIVDNQLYRHPEGGEGVPGHVSWFEDGLKTLCALRALPNVDFILTHEDGTREAYYQVAPHLQAPLFGWAKCKSTPFLVLIPDYRSLASCWHDDIRRLTEGKKFVGEPVPWERKEQIAFWRGGLTEWVHRVFIARLSQQFPSLLDAGLTDPCDFPQKPPANYEEHLRYKYLPVLDGIMCTYPGYQWRLLSDSVCFKQESDQVQWFYGALKPYVHYVPVQNDLADLIDQIHWARAHDAECKQIAANSTAFARNGLMYDDVYCYLYHVLVAYSRLQDESLAHDWGNTSHWIPL